MNRRLEADTSDCEVECDWDHEAFEDLFSRAGLPREGYWSLFSALAWIASRSDKFVAAAQIHEEEDQAIRGVSIRQLYG